MRRLLVPDLALLGAAVTLFYCLFLFDGGRRLFRDSDSGWHIRTGESILAGAGLPHTDPYSWSRAGEPWFAWEWGAGVMMGMTHRAGGLAGVALMYMVAISTCTWLWFRLHWLAGGDFLIACAMASPMLSTANMHWLARPHVLGWVLLLGWIACAEKRPSSFRWWHGLAAALASALWANVHASFFLFPAIALLYAAAHALRPLVWELEPGRERRAALWFVMIALFSAAGSLCNPYGWRLHAHLYSYLSNRELLQRVGEFQSFNFHSEGAFQILLAAGLAALGAVLALGQKKLAHFLLGVAFLALALRSARGLPLVALVLLPLANGALTTALRSAGGLRPAVRRALDGFLRYSGNLRALETGFRGYAWAPVLIVVAYAAMASPVLQARVGFPPEEFPVEASVAVERLPADARLLAPDKFGGYLIYRFSGRRRVFFDGRSDFYGIDFMKDYIRLVQVRPGWQQQVSRFGFTHALLPNDYSLLGALEQAGWRRLHRDATATLVERPNP